MSIVCKLFIRTRNESPDASVVYELGAVCRGETNKDWAAATPSGSLKHGADPKLDAVWAAKLAGEIVNPEVLVYVFPDTGGDWKFEKCQFSYGGAQVAFRQSGQPWGSLELTINATPATKVLREEFAASLMVGEAARFSLRIEPAVD